MAPIGWPTRQLQYAGLRGPDTHAAGGERVEEQEQGADREAVEHGESKQDELRIEILLILNRVAPKLWICY